MSETIRALLLMSTPMIVFYLIYFIHYLACKIRCYYILEQYSTIYNRVGCFETLDYGYKTSIGTIVELIKDNHGNIEVLKNNSRIATLRSDMSNRSLGINNIDKAVGVITGRKKGASASHYNRGPRTTTHIQYYIYIITIFKAGTKSSSVEDINNKLGMQGKSTYFQKQDNEYGGQSRTYPNQTLYDNKVINQRQEINTQSDENNFQHKESKSDKKIEDVKSDIDNKEYSSEQQQLEIRNYLNEQLKIYYKKRDELKKIKE